jgi:ribonucleoside-triphosphate reductase
MLNNEDDFVTILPVLISLLSREASTEIVLDGVIQLLLKYTQEPSKIESQFARALLGSSAAPSYSLSGLPTTTLSLPAYDLDSKLISALLNGYRRYAESTPIPRIGISLNYNRNGLKPEDQSEYIATTLLAGGIISVSQNGSRGSNGVRKIIDHKDFSTIMGLQSLSINLPRLAYQSNKDETYFRARLALMMKPVLAAMSIRKKSITDLIRKGMIPTLSSNTLFMQTMPTNILINLTGLKESVYDIMGYSSENTGAEIFQKVLKTAADVIIEQGKRLGEDHVGIAMIFDDSAGRFVELDSDRYGKTSLLSNQQNDKPAYSQGLTLNGKDLLSSEERAANIINECKSLDKLLNGGLSVTLDLSDFSSSILEIKNAIKAVSDLNFFRPSIRLLICSTCGKKARTQFTEICEFCKSPYLLSIKQ